MSAGVEILAGHYSGAVVISMVRNDIQLEILVCHYSGAVVDSEQWWFE